MINLHSIYQINIQNLYQYYFDKDFGSGCFFSYNNGNGISFGHKDGIFSGDGFGYPIDYLIKNYNTND